MKAQTTTVAQVTKRLNKFFADKKFNLKARTVGQTVVVDNFNTHFIADLCDLINYLVGQGSLVGIVAENISWNHARIKFV